MALETTKWDTSEILDSPEMIAAYIEAVMEDGAPELIVLALGNIARSRGMSEMARKTGITREGLYKALGKHGDPKLSTFLAVIRSLGLRLSVKPLDDGAGEPGGANDDGLRRAS